jgi:hypothetical protein
VDGANVAEGISDDRHWCCPQGTDAAIDTIKAISSKVPPGKTFVYFKNAQDTYADCDEFSRATSSLQGAGADVVFVGFQLQQSQLARTGAPRKSGPPPAWPGVNLLVPLLPEHSEMPEGDVHRLACHERHWLASFSGHRSVGLRDKLFNLKYRHPRIHIHESAEFGDEDPLGYESLLRDSVFAYVPRGDEHYTFRLTEVLAAGAIPVVFDDDFVAPFNNDDMNTWAIQMPESYIPASPMMFDLMSNETICSLKRNGTAIWHRAQNISTMVFGMLEGLQRARATSSSTTTTTTASGTRKGSQGSLPTGTRLGSQRTSPRGATEELALSSQEGARMGNRRGSQGSLPTGREHAADEASNRGLVIVVASASGLMVFLLLACVWWLIGRSISSRGRDDRDSPAHADGLGAEKDDEDMSDQVSGRFARSFVAWWFKSCKPRGRQYRNIVRVS